MAKNALKNQTKIVDDLLEVSRIRTEKYGLNIEKLDLIDVITPIINDIKSAAKFRKISIETVFEEPLPPIRASFSEFRHAFYNVIENAVKFNKDGGRVTVTAKDAGEYIEVDIEDTGIGIPEEHLCRIFEMFYQIDQSTTRGYGGTGIGLAITRDILEAHSGTVKVESNQGIGTIVTFNVPTYK